MLQLTMLFVIYYSKTLSIEAFYKSVQNLNYTPHKLSGALFFTEVSNQSMQASHSSINTSSEFTKIVIMHMPWMQESPIDTRGVTPQVSFKLELAKQGEVLMSIDK